MNMLDIMEIEAEARNFSMYLPPTKPVRALLLRRIAEAIQKRQGHFFFCQLYDVLERVYPREMNGKEKNLLAEMEHWVENDNDVEFVKQEGGFYMYRLLGNQNV